MTFLSTELTRPRGADDSPDRLRAFLLANLNEALKSYGVEVAPILRQASLKPDALDDDFAWIPLDKFAAVLTLSAKATGDPCFSLKFGSATRFTSNPLGYLMANAPNLKAALKACADFHAVVSSNPIKFVETSGGGRVEWSCPVTVSDTVQLTDFGIMRLVWRIQAVAGNAWRPVSVGMMHRQPANIAEYGRLLGSKIVFDQPNNSITIAGATLQLPVPHADPQLFKLVMRFCEEQLQRQKAVDHPLNQIRDTMIACLEQGSYGPDDIAAALGIGPRILHRRLKAEGSSFQRLLDDTRRCLTHRYLVETSLKLTDIAAKVGYSELSAFSRAARRWFGMSPRTLRRRPSNLDEAA
jgi:AraC-like DNA-binding protein